MRRINYITSLYYEEGLSIRKIAEKTGHHFNTVKKYLEKEDWNVEIKPKKERESKLEPLKPIIDKWLMDDKKAPPKQRHTAKQIFKRLSKEHEKELAVGLSTVTAYVKKARKKLYSDICNTAIYGSHEAGWGQLDFGEVYIYGKSGKLEKHHELILTFPHSNAGYVQLCKSENAENLLEGMQRIFAYIGKVPNRILFDNMSSAVVKILPEKERQLADMFRRFMLHYKIEAVFCNPAKGQEKGNVENKVGYKRRNYFVPVPRVSDLRQYNMELLGICDEDMKREHYRKKEQISDLFLEDVEAMHNLPSKEFTVCRLVKAKTDKYSFVTLENNKYSVTPKYYQCEVWVEVSAEKVRILNDTYKEVACHDRRYGMNAEPIIDWMSYLPAIARKPNALKYTGFFKQLPVVWQEYFTCASYADSKNMLSVLTPIILDGKLDDATVAMELHDIKNADEFLLVYRNLTEPPKLPELKLDNVPVQLGASYDLSIYADFLGGDA